MKACLRVCTAASCRSRGAASLQHSLSEAIARAGLEHRLSVKEVGCLGPCSDGPLLAMDASPEAPTQLYGSIRAADAAQLAASLTQAATRHTLAQWCPAGGQRIDLNHPFFQLQRRLVLEHCGQIDPTSIEEALAAGAYRQLERVLQTNTPTAVIEQVRRSGLRGRGGAGYPTGLKWAAVAQSPGTEKLVVCNADEGDPGAFMDRTVLEGDPHAVLEGMAIAAHAVGASRGFVYVRAEYPLAIARLRSAIAAAHGHGWLGMAIAGSRFNFDVELRVGAGAYVCGEETALMQSIEGKRGMPRPRPPYPAERGVFGLPTLINNVETFANLPALLRLGLESYGRGTKVFSLTGHVRRSGVIEVPMGTSLRTIVETMGGGAPAGRSIKAVQTGGPSGGCVPANQLDTPVDYESLKALGTIMGSGGMVVMDDTTNMVDIARFFMAFCREESCGKCVPCRAGTVQLDNLLEKLLEGRAAPGDLEQLERLCHMVKDTSLCGLGQGAPKPVLSTLRHFRDDYLALVPAETSR
jgi:bidirectional [NiFe] hydrogenase diaphorase subunit